MSDEEFEQRFFGPDATRPGDVRDQYQRDKGRIIHSAGFRRLQGKTQVMGVGEGDFHRTRLTHSIEAGQIGEGLLLTLRDRHQENADISRWLPDTAVIVAACYAHDLGHPPFGHSGERVLHTKMVELGGFEGNAQTLRIIIKLEKYQKNRGINPTRRIILAVLKYPVSYALFDKNRYHRVPPKCYYETEAAIVEWALSAFLPSDHNIVQERDDNDKPKHRSLDFSIMELADDIAYAVHDLEDIVARRLVGRRDIQDWFEPNNVLTQPIECPSGDICRESFMDRLFDKGSHDRKNLISCLVNMFVANVYIETNDRFSHPLLRYRAELPVQLKTFMEHLKQMTYKLVIPRAEVQQLERRGRRVVEALFDELVAEPEKLIPHSAWNDLDPSDAKERRVCDYIAGMTDPFAERMFHRLFTPGFGSSRDEL